MIDTKVAHYRILKNLGRDGMGEVYLAEDTSLDRKVALKTLASWHFINPTLYSGWGETSKPRR